MRKDHVLIMALLMVLNVGPLHAATVNVNCTISTLSNALALLTKTDTNLVNISGNCIEDVEVAGFRDLTLNGIGAASITTTESINDFPTGTALTVDQRSSVTVQALTLNGGNLGQGALCTGRSYCLFRNVTFDGGLGGLSVQSQSGADIVGTSKIQNFADTGLGVYAASTVNLHPEPNNDTTAGPVISGQGLGVAVQDGAYLRADNVSISGNYLGIYAQRNAVLKIFGPMGKVNNNMDIGIFAQLGSAVQVNAAAVSNNGGDGIYLGPLSSVQLGNGAAIKGNGKWSVNCEKNAVTVARGFGNATWDKNNCGN